MSQIAFTGRGSSGEFPFVKMHGLRNFFVILDLRGRSWRIPPDDVIRICDMRSGVGGEELVTIEQPSEAGRTAGAAAFMRIYNPDGQEVSACGNATRCVAYLLMQESGSSVVSIETAAGLLQCRSSGEFSVSVDLGPIKSGWRDIPLRHEVDTSSLRFKSGPLREGTAVSVGNPHTVFFVQSVASVDIPRFAPIIQNDPIFFEGTNVGVGEVIDSSTIKLAVWERPGMLTEACGTGACAAAFVARRRGLIESDIVTVHLPGGALAIQLYGNVATMTGPVAICCRGYLPLMHRRQFSAN